MTGFYSADRLFSSFGSLFGRCRFFYRSFFNDFFFWLVLAKLFRVADRLLLIASSFLYPLRELHASFFEKLSDTRCWLRTVIEVLLCEFNLNIRVFSVWVVASYIRNNTTA